MGDVRKIRGLTNAVVILQDDGSTIIAFTGEDGNRRDHHYRVQVCAEGLEALLSSLRNHVNLRERRAEEALERARRMDARMRGDA